MKEKLSALIDGELQSNDCQAHLGRLRTDTELRRAWDAYHLIGDALRGHIGADLTGRVVARCKRRRGDFGRFDRILRLARRAAVRRGYRDRRLRTGDPRGGRPARDRRDAAPDRGRSRELSARTPAVFPHECHAGHRALRAHGGCRAPDRAEMMFSRASRLFGPLGVLSFLLPVSAAIAQTEPSALQWLQRIYAATQKLSYTGTFVYQQGQQ